MESMVEDQPAHTNTHEPSTVDSFRAEIREQVVILSQLNRIKVVIAAGLTAVAFGIGADGSPLRDQSYLVLCLVPFTCVYVDLQYYHGLAKIFVLARFLTALPDDIVSGRLIKEYEQYVERIRTRLAPRLFTFETRAQLGSTLVMSLTGPLLGIPLVLGGTTVLGGTAEWTRWHLGAVGVLCTTALVGGLLAVLQYRLYRNELAKVKAAAVRPDGPPTSPGSALRLIPIPGPTTRVIVSSVASAATSVAATTPLVTPPPSWRSAASDDAGVPPGESVSAPGSDLLVPCAGGHVAKLCVDGNNDLRVAVAGAAAVYGFGGHTTGPVRNNATFALINEDTHFGTTSGYTYASFPVGLIRIEGTWIGFLWNRAGPASVTTFCDHEETVVRIAPHAGNAVDHEIFLTSGSGTEVAAALTELTGRPALQPLWALGFHQSRWSYKSARHVRKIAREMRQRDVPCDAIHLDIHYMDGYRVFTWDHSRFPEPDALAADLRQSGIRLVAIVNPGVKAEPGFHVFDDGKARGVFCRRRNGSLYVGDVWPGRCVFPDFRNEWVRRWWAGQHRPLLTRGVSGIWNDMNEPVLSLRHHVDPTAQDLWHGSVPHSQYRNQYGNGQSEAARQAIETIRRERPFVLTRSGTVGVQKSAAIWTGDNQTSWESLRENLYTVIHVGLSGVTMCGADVGGFANAAPVPSKLKPIKIRKNKELFSRWIQLGSLMPFFRVHTCLYSYNQEPWSFGDEVLRIARKHVRRRYALMPYLYTLMHHAHRTGAPLVRPMSFAFEGADDLNDQFMLGDDLMAAPLLTPDANERSVWIPPGQWHAFETGEVFRGPSRHAFAVTDDDYPLLVRSGSILPLATVGRNASETMAGVLALEVYPSTTLKGMVTFDDFGESVAAPPCDVALTGIWTDATHVEIRSDITQGHWLGEPRTLVLRVPVDWRGGEEDELPVSVSYDGRTIRWRETPFRLPSDSRAFFQSPKTSPLPQM